jgi:hypothetical protein
MVSLRKLRSTPDCSLALPTPVPYKGNDHA